MGQYLNITIVLGDCKDICKEGGSNGEPSETESSTTVVSTSKATTQTTAPSPLTTEPQSGFIL